jgi:hypothetical protein
VRMERGKQVEGFCGSQPIVTVAMPKAALVSVAQDTEQECVERVIRFPFQETGGVFLKVRHYYVVKELQKKVTVVKKVSEKSDWVSEKDALKGRDLSDNSFDGFYPAKGAEKSKFIEALKDTLLVRTA